jgi:hypothetical protein
MSNFVRNPRTRSRVLPRQLKPPRTPPTRRCERGGGTTPPLPDLISTPGNHPTELPLPPKIRASCSPPCAQLRCLLSSTTHLGEFHSSRCPRRSSGSREKPTGSSMPLSLASPRGVAVAAIVASSQCRRLPTGVESRPLILKPTV